MIKMPDQTRDQRSSLRAESARVSVQTTFLCLVSKPALEAHRWNG